MTATKSDRQKSADIMRATVGTLHRILMFVTTVRIQKYIVDQRATNYSDFEQELSNLMEHERLDGVGVLATRKKLLTKPSFDEKDFLRDGIGLASEELGAYIDAFPLDAAGASFLFTLLEVYGDDVAAIVKPGSIPRNKAWHEDVKGFADLRDSVQVRKAREAFGKHFDVDANEVPEHAARRMVKLKKARNDFAHDRGHAIDFDGFLRDTAAVVCHIAFLTTKAKRISVYPWEDHLDVFRPQTKS